VEWWLKNRVVARARDWFRRHWQGALRWRERFVFKEEALHLVLAGIVGLIGGLVNLFFFYAVHFMQPGEPVEFAEKLPDWERLLVPTLGGLVAGLILYWGFRWVGRQGSSDLLEVIIAGDGRLPFRTESVKTASALVSIASGASIGREGGITQLSATLASKLGQLAKWPPYRLRLLVGCGASAGIAAAYNAPIAGAVFASLIVLGNFSMSLFAPLVCASVIATTVSRSFFGIEPWYQVPAFPATTPAQLPWFVLMGVLCGGVSALFLKLLRGSRERFNQLRWPIYAKLTLAGLIVGAIAIGFPGVCGNGYYVTNRILQGDFADAANPLPELGGVFLAKLLATVATVGAGTVGGVFTPTLFLGAGAGALFGVALHLLNWAPGEPAGAFALVGMGAMLAGTTKSPLLAMIMAFEISLDYSLMPALMLACVVSVLVARQLHGDSIYTEHMRLKGLSLQPESDQAGVAMEKTVGDLMRAPIPPLRETTTFRQIADRFLVSSNNFLPIVDAKQQFIGVVALQDLKEFLNTGQNFDGVIAFDVMRPPPRFLTPGQRLLDALPVVLESELRNVPVVNSPKEKRLVGSVSRAEVLAIFSQAIAEKSKPAG